jgi:hypothetical protein
MAVECSICKHPAASDLDAGIVAGVPYRQLVKRYVPAVSISALSRHRKDHLSPSIVALAGETGTGTGPERGSLVEQLRAIQDRVMRVLERAESEGKISGFLAGAREIRALLELQARLTGELDERPVTQVVNLMASPEWMSVQTTILRALMPYPEARIAVADALVIDAPLELTT